MIMAIGFSCIDRGCKMEWCTKKTILPNYSHGFFASFKTKKETMAFRLVMPLGTGSSGFTDSSGFGSSG
jgi:hypothetical protein